MGLKGWEQNTSMQQRIISVQAVKKNGGTLKKTEKKSVALFLYNGIFSPIIFSYNWVTSIFGSFDHLETPSYLKLRLPWAKGHPRNTLQKSPRELRRWRGAHAPSPAWGCWSRRVSFNGCSWWFTVLQRRPSSLSTWVDQIVLSDSVLGRDRQFSIAWILIGLNNKNLESDMG